MAQSDLLLHWPHQKEYISRFKLSIHFALVLAAAQQTIYYNLYSRGSGMGSHNQVKFVNTDRHHIDNTCFQTRKIFWNSWWSSILYPAFNLNLLGTFTDDAYDWLKMRYPSYQLFSGPLMMLHNMTMGFLQYDDLNDGCWGWLMVREWLCRCDLLLSNTAVEHSTFFFLFFWGLKSYSWYLQYQGQEIAYSWMTWRRELSVSMSTSRCWNIRFPISL